jgi:hypothetical protein
MYVCMCVRMNERYLVIFWGKQVIMHLNNCFRKIRRNTLLGLGGNKNNKKFTHLILLKYKNNRFIDRFSGALCLSTLIKKHHTAVCTTDGNNGFELIERSEFNYYHYFNTSSVETSSVTTASEEQLQFVIPQRLLRAPLGRSQTVPYNKCIYEKCEFAVRLLFRK